MDSNLFDFRSKEEIMIEIKGEMSPEGAKEVAAVTAQGRKWLIISAAVSLLLVSFGLTAFLVLSALG